MCMIHIKHVSRITMYINFVSFMNRLFACIPIWSTSCPIEFYPHFSCLCKCSPVKTVIWSSLRAIMLFRRLSEILDKTSILPSWGQWLFKFLTWCILDSSFFYHLPVECLLPHWLYTVHKDTLSDLNSSIFLNNHRLSLNMSWNFTF